MSKQPRRGKVPAVGGNATRLLQASLAGADHPTLAEHPFYWGWACQSCLSTGCSGVALPASIMRRWTITRTALCGSQALGGRPSAGAAPLQCSRRLVSTTIRPGRRALLAEACACWLLPICSCSMGLVSDRAGHWVAAINLTTPDDVRVAIQLADLLWALHRQDPAPPISRTQYAD